MITTCLLSSFISRREINALYLFTKVISAYAKISSSDKRTLNTVDPWTTWRFGASTLPTTENPHITYSQPSGSMVLHSQIQSTLDCVALRYLLLKKCTCKWRREVQTFCSKVTYSPTVSCYSLPFLPLFIHWTFTNLQSLWLAFYLHMLNASCLKGFCTIPFSFWFLYSWLLLIQIWA